MRPLKSSERRTIRITLSFMLIYLALFGGFRAWRTLEGKRIEYEHRVNIQRIRRNEKSLLWLIALVCLACLVVPVAVHYWPK